ncbi:MAG TPA: helix-turn-helix transcriptional regulator [Caulobacteraceae bacterium]|nr:helix-turn-helix transcriptional regulator [Caulobacteraceae bacterium]
MRWARKRAGFDTAKEAADRLAISDVTYRSYEKPIENDGRWPRTSQLQRIAKVFRVDWAWLETGQGDPGPTGVAEDVVEFLHDAQEKAEVIDLTKRREAMRAALSVLESFRKA